MIGLSYDDVEIPEKRVLVIYEEVPEDTYAFIIPEPTKDELRMLRLAHGGFLNRHDLTAEQEKALRWVMDQTDKYPKITCRPHEEPIEGAFRFIVVCGILL